MSKNRSLSPADVERLLSDRSPEARAETVEKIAGSLVERTFSETERKEAEGIFRLLVNDTELLVRKTLAETLKAMPDLPRDIAKVLASDISDVASPILSFSDALNDEDLLEIISTKSAEHQAAIAGRVVVSEAVSDRLADTGNEQVVATLMENEGARISEKTYEKVLDKYGENEKISTPIAKRKSLPLTVTERLVTLVSDRLREYLVSHHEMSPTVATDLILESREKTMIGLIKGGASHTDLVSLIDQLHENNRLTPTIILRALCVGDIDFFETALAKGAGIAVSNVHMLVNDAGGAGLKQLCKKCKIPGGLVQIMRVAIDVVNELEYDGDPGDRERFRNTVIERVLTHFEDQFDAENVDYLISKMKSVDSSTQAA
ncbi:DUF2336 domain-containing protein [Sneathiella chinensis]|uniref:DUF2336 domain-containing protein n=1 Tax=Sneathiella chinensis TaxID=349750 RepID=A0ABQ5U110_9PROT|nr:DUF2336 domain-containing protein [Sneathiella chinensis]GLQ05797.1 hypothetical protein GCM10007924_10180 [Sneathiella chinensis]